MAVLTPAALVIWGVFVGLWFGSRLGRHKTETDASPTEPNHTEIPKKAEDETTSALSGPNEAELVANRLLCGHQAEEIALLGQRLSASQRRAEETRQRLGQWTRSADESPAEPALNQASASLWHLEESLRHLAGQRESAQARVARLESRLDEATGQLEEGARRIAEFRASDSSGGSDRPLSAIDDQLRVLRQNLSGCVAKAARAREHLRGDEAALKEATREIGEARERLESRAWDEVGERIERSAAEIEKLRADSDQEFGEMIGRIDWAVRESPSGFLKAIDQLGESAETGTMLPIEIWRLLGEMRGSLAGLGVTLEHGAADSAIATCGKRSLAESLAQVRESIHFAKSRATESVEPSDTDTGTPEPDKTGAPVAAAASVDVSELEALRFSNAARDGEIAKLRHRLGEKEGEVESLRREVEEARKTATGSPQVAAGAATPRLAPIPLRRPMAESGTAVGPRSSRQFIRRLLGLGGRAARAASPVMVESGTNENLVAVPAASLAEARAALSDLRHRSLSEETPGDSHGHPVGGGKNGGAPAVTEAEAAAEVKTLRERLDEKSARITALEAELAALRQAASSPSKAEETSADSDSTELPLPSVIGSHAPGVS
ncbi:MAG: hypothetical protein KDN19_22735, partial [Verrucomicrobiae bacterium]|nr:hypothetical protein [Verrucomicrobiae bacterium]